MQGPSQSKTPETIRTCCPDKTKKTEIEVEIEIEIASFFAKIAETIKID